MKFKYFVSVSYTHLDVYKRQQHIRGTQNVVADTLSRMFHLPNTRPGEDNVETITVSTLITEFPLAFKDIAHHQQQDPKLYKIIEQIEKENYSDKYTLSKRVLCFKKANGKSLRIIAPEIIKPINN